MAGRQMQLEDWLDDLCVRFVINLPQEDLSSVARICFQVEEAQWFYEDFIRPLDPTLPSMSLRTFCLRIFQHCPLLASFPVENHVQAFEEFIQYKTRVPVRGAIMLNAAMDSVVLVKGWKKGANWSFPRGKINKDEDDLDCAVREVYEETGLDLREAGLVPKEAKPKYIEIPMREQHLRLYVIRDVPMDTNFQPRTRKEISKIEWYKLSDLPTLRKKGPQNLNLNLGQNQGQNQSHPNGPQYDSSGPGANANKFYMVAPFLVPLKKWIVSQKKAADKKAVADLYPSHPLKNHLPIEEEPTADEAWNASSNARANPAADADAAPRTLPIESLDGATRELQRLLNVQPVNVQQRIDAAAAAAAPPPPENKASALLSLLQPTSAAARPPPQPQSQPLRPQPDPTAAAGPSSYITTPSPYPGFNAAPQSQASNRVPLAHNLPPPRYTQAQPPPLLSQQQSSSFSGFPQQANLPQPHGHPAAAFLTGQSLPPQIHQPPSFAARQPPLQGQALALLNAFKQGPAPAPPSLPKDSHAQQQPQQQQQQQAAPEKPFTSPYSQYAIPSGVPPTTHPEAKSPGGLVGSILGPARQQQHKSALLGLLKAQTADPAAAKHDAPATDPTSAERSLLAQLQNTSLASNQPQRPPQQIARESNPPQFQAQSNTKAQTLLPNPEDILVDRTSRKREKRPAKTIAAGTSPNASHPRQSGRPPKNAAAAAAAATSSTATNTSRPSKPAPQPTRILQRGQSLQSLGVAAADPPLSAEAAAPGPAPKSPAFTLPTALPAQPLLPVAQPPLQPYPAPSYQADVSQEQKRQLLSLFGAAPQVLRQPQQQQQQRQQQQQQSQQQQKHQEPNARAGSSTGEKAISQADQSFLLDYLQSVTNTAAGR